VHSLIGVTELTEMSGTHAFPEFIQLMDDDIVSLIGLTVIADPSCRDALRLFFYLSINQLILSLYLMTQCQIKLHHPITSLAETFNYAEVVRRERNLAYILNQLLLKLIERKILLYIGGQLL